MFVSFDLLVFLAWVFFSTFLPGAMLSCSLLRKEESLCRLEKILIGFAMGFVLLPLIPFLLYLVAGIKFSYSIVLLSVGILYAIAIAAVILTKKYEDISELRSSLAKVNEYVASIGAVFNANSSTDSDSNTSSKSTSKSKTINYEPIRSMAIPAALILILLMTYLVRIGTYSPIYQELDPYYYTNAATQLLTVGENPFNDQTAWYPEVQVSHRVIPAISYLESSWYSLYTQGGSYNNMLLAIIASMYPPLAAVLSVFFIYLLVSTCSKREWGLVAAGIATFIPIFVLKLTAGEQEVQPYAFFALAFFYAMYVISLRKKEIFQELSIPFGSGSGSGASSSGSGFKFKPGKDIIFPILTGLAFAALALGSASQVVAVVSIILFVAGQSILYFIRDEDSKELRHLLLVNLIFFIIGPLLVGAIIRPMFEGGAPSFGISIAILLPILFLSVLYLAKRIIPDRTFGVMLLAGILVVGLCIFVATPLGDYVKNLGRAGFEIAQYNSALERTIAEQGDAPTAFESQLGFITQSYYSSTPLTTIGSLLSLILFVLMLVPSILVNILLGFFVWMANMALGTNVVYGAKDTSLLLFWILAFWVSSLFAFWRFIKKQDDACFLFFLAIIMPPLVVGLIKAKYTIYSGVLLAIAIGISISNLISLFERFAKDDSLKKLIYMYLLLFGALLVVLQLLLSQSGLAFYLLWGSLQPLYQNNPEALAAKFQSFCSSSQDQEVCAAATSPRAYASLGTDYQYNYKLCLLSIFSKYSYLQDASTAPPWETSAYFRCQRLSTYWVESMDWIHSNTELNARITSWWDYGHWINFFGERNAVTRNEHASLKMIGDVAHGYLDATPEELRDWMQAHDSEYALFDVELLSSGSSLGGKYSALNYLSCARDNLTSVNQIPGASGCEADHLWETIFVSSNPCTISSLTGKTGFTAYKIYYGPDQIYLPYYPSQCVEATDSTVISFCQQAIRAVPVYCVGNVTLADGETMYGTYYLNETYPNGDLKLNKARFQFPYRLDSTYHLGSVTGITLLYTNDKIWLENGVVKGGYEDRKGKFYDSALYRALVLGDLPGFTLVYSTPSGAVRVYKIDNFRSTNTGAVNTLGGG